MAHPTDPRWRSCGRCSCGARWWRPWWGCCEVAVAMIGEGDRLFARRLLHAQHIAQAVLAHEPKKAKKKYTPKHRVLGTRECLCGETFNVTTKRPDQQSCGRYCIGRSSALAKAAKRANDDRRLDRFYREVQAALKSQRVSVGDLVDLCMRVYQWGYKAGYQIARNGYAPTIAPVED